MLEALDMEVNKVVGVFEVWLVIEDESETVVDWVRDIWRSVDKRRIVCAKVGRAHFNLELSFISLSAAVRAELEEL
jgi:hypothetical protein